MLRLTRFSAAVVLLVALLVAGCGGGRPPATVLAVDGNFRTYRQTVDIFAASNRNVGVFDTVTTFANRRARTTGYEEINITIPPKHVVGNIEWPTTGTVDPSTDFMTVGHDNLDQQQYFARVSAAAARSNGKVLVFVHGYNTRYQESVYRMAQIVHDTHYNGTSILFSWPSRGKVALYLADRESVAFSRDAFEAFLLQLARTPNVREINILGHSMGTFLVMQTLEIMAIKGHRDLRGKLADVVLAAADIDRDVFERQLINIGPRRHPITVVASKNDSALSLSTLLDGQNERVGLLTSDDLTAIQAARKYNLRIIDASNVKSTDTLGHTTFAQSEALLTAIGTSLNHAGGEQPGVFVSVQDAGTKILQAPAKLFQSVTGGIEE